MVRRRTLSSLVVLLLVACQPPGGVTGKKASPRSGETTQAASSPGPATSATASSKPSVVAKLEAPSGQAVALSGIVQVDPAYIVQAKAGSVLGNVLAAGGNAARRADGALTANGRVVADGPGNVVAVVGGAVIGQGPFPAVISDAGSGLVTANASDVATSDAGNVVAPGAGIIANNGSSIVSNNGGAIVANNGSARHALQAASPQVPGAGMLVGALSLRTHRYLPLGTYQGRDVYAIYTNADGAYKLYLPHDEAGNVLVVACPPGSTNDDRMIYNVVTEPKAHEEPIDEDRALVGRYLHFAFAARMAEVLTTDATGVDRVIDRMGQDGHFPAPALEALRGFLHRVNEEGATYGVPRWKNPRDLNALATTAADISLSYLDPHVRVTKEAFPDLVKQEEEAVDAIGDALRRLREATSARLAAAPGFFATPFQFHDTCGVDAPDAIEVRKSTDPGDYLVSHFLAKNELNAFYNIGLIYRALAVDGGQELRMEAASFTILQALVPLILTHDDVIPGITAFCTRPGFKPEQDPTLQPRTIKACP